MICPAGYLTLSTVFDKGSERVENDQILRDFNQFLDNHYLYRSCLTSKVEWRILNRLGSEIYLFDGVNPPIRISDHFWGLRLSLVLRDGNFLHRKLAEKFKKMHPECRNSFGIGFPLHPLFRDLFYGFWLPEGQVDERSGLQR